MHNGFEFCLLMILDFVCGFILRTKFMLSKRTGALGGPTARKKLLASSNLKGTTSFHKQTWAKNRGKELTLGFKRRNLSVHDGFPLVKLKKNGLDLCIVTGIIISKYGNTAAGGLVYGMGQLLERSQSLVQISKTPELCANRCVPQSKVASHL